MTFFPKVNNRVWFHIICFLNFSITRYVLLTRCVSIRAAERLSREWAYFGGLLFWELR
jgi:hypothetical protein